MIIHIQIWHDDAVLIVLMLWFDSWMHEWEILKCNALLSVLPFQTDNVTNFLKASSKLHLSKLKSNNHIFLYQIIGTQMPDDLVQHIKLDSQGIMKTKITMIQHQNYFHIEPTLTEHPVSIGFMHNYIHNVHNIN